MKILGHIKGYRKYNKMILTRETGQHIVKLSRNKRRPLENKFLSSSGTSHEKNEVEPSRFSNYIAVVATDTDLWRHSFRY